MLSRIESSVNAQAEKTQKAAKNTAKQTDLIAVGVLKLLKENTAERKFDENRTNRCRYLATSAQAAVDIQTTFINYYRIFL